MSIRIPVMGPGDRGQSSITPNVPSAPSVGEASANALSGLGGQMAGFAKDLIHKRKRSQEINFQAKSDSQVRSSIDAVYREASTSFNPDDKESSISRPIRERVMEQVELLAENAPSSDAAQAFRVNAEGLINKFEIRANGEEHERRLKSGIEHYQNMVTESGRGLTLNPDEGAAMELYNNASDIVKANVAENIWSPDFGAQMQDAARSSSAKSLLLGYQAQDTPGAFSRGIAFLRSDSELAKGLTPQETASFLSRFRSGLEQAQKKEANIFLKQHGSLVSSLYNGQIDPDSPDGARLIDRVGNSLNATGSLNDVDRAQKSAQLNSAVRISREFKNKKFLNYSVGDIEQLAKAEVATTSAEVREALKGTPFADLGVLIEQEGVEAAQVLEKALLSNLQQRLNDGAGSAIETSEAFKLKAQEALSGIMDFSGDSSEVFPEFMDYAAETLEIQKQFGNPEGLKYLLPEASVKQMATTLESLGNPQRQMNFITHIRESTGKHFNRVMGEMINRGGLDNRYNILVGMDQENPVAMENMLEVIQDPKAIEKAFKDIHGSDTVAKLVGGAYSETVDELQGVFLQGTQNDSQMYRAYHDMIESRAQQLMVRSSLRPKDAFAKAKREILPGEFFSDRGSQTFIPEFYVTGDESGGAYQTRVDKEAVRDFLSQGQRRRGSSRFDVDPSSIYFNLGVDIPDVSEEVFGLANLDPSEKVVRFHEHVARDGYWAYVPNSDDGFSGYQLMIPDPENEDLPMQVHNFKREPIRISIAQLAEDRVPTFSTQIVDAAMEAVISSFKQEERRGRGVQPRRHKVDPEEMRRIFERSIGEIDSHEKKVREIFRSAPIGERKRLVEEVYQKLKNNFSQEPTDG